MARGRRGRRSRSKQNQSGKSTSTSSSSSSSSSSSGGGGSGGSSGGSGGGGNSGGGNSGGNNSGGKNNSKKKSYTKAQIAAKNRIAAGKTISQVKAANTAAMKAAAAQRNAAFQAKKKGGTSAQVARDNAMYGNTFPAGGLTISDAGRAQAEANKEAARKEATRKSMFDPTRANTNLFSFSAGFNNPLTSNNYFNLGKNVRVPNEDTASFRKLFKDDISQVTRTDKGFQTGDKSIKSFRPFKAFTKDMLATGPTPLARQMATRFLPGALKNISLGSQIFNQGREDSGLTRSLNEVGNINAGGLSIGFKSDPSTDIGARVGSFFTSLPGKVANLFSGQANAAETTAGGLNIGSAAQAGEGGEATSNTGRTVVTTDKDKNISYDGLGIAKDVALGSLDALTGNRFDFDNLGRPGDDKTFTQKFETFKKSPLQQAIISKQTGIDAKRLINEGESAAKSLFSNYIGDMDASTKKGVRNPIARFLKDVGSDDATAMAGRAIDAFGYNDPNFSDDPNKLTKMLKFTGLPQLSQENVQDMRHTLNKDVTEPTGIQGKSMLKNVPYTQALGLANRIVSGKLSDATLESMNQLGMGNVGGIDDAINLGMQINTNKKLEGTTANKRFGELDNLIQKYGPGKGQIPTIQSIIKGIGGAVNRTGASGNTMQIQGGNNMTASLPVNQQVAQEVFPLPTATAQTGTNSGDLANIMQNAYASQMSLYGMNPNYFANIMQPRFNTRPRKFRQVFNRGYF